MPNEPIPIGKQCAAVRILINAAARGTKFKPSEIKFFEDKWEAAFESLMWLQLNEEKIKKALRDGSVSKPDRANLV